MLFGEKGVGIDRIKLVTCSASDISRLNNTQIQNIIDYVNDRVHKTVTIGNDQSHVSSKTVTNGNDLTSVTPQASVPSASSRTPIPRTNPNKMECLYQYAVEHGLDPEKFSIVTEADKKRWAGESFRGILEVDMRFYCGAIEGKEEDPRKYRKFLTDRERMIGEELLRRDILKHRSSTAWLDDLMKEWEKTHTQFIQIFGQALYQNSIPIVSVKA